MTALLLLLTITACDGRDEAWPSLTRRPIEGPAPPTEGPRRCAVAASCGPVARAPVVPIVSPTPEVAPGEVAPIIDVPAQLAVIERDLQDVTTRLAAQTTAARAARAAARGTRQDSPAWSQAELEQTALDRIGNQIGEVRGRLDTIAGLLAAAASSGVAVGPQLTATGRLINRAAVLQKTYGATTAETR